MTPEEGLKNMRAYGQQLSDFYWQKVKSEKPEIPDVFREFLKTTFYAGFSSGVRYAIFGEMGPTDAAMKGKEG